MAQQFFYDQQIRRFLIQFIRMISNFQVEFGKDRTGSTTLQRVPVIYGDSSRQAAQIIRQNSENALNTVPAMAVYISDLKYARDRVQNPTYVSKLNLREREYDPITGDYTTQQNGIFTVERLMPVPYDLTLKVDIWTSNTEQKLQLIEQLSVLFNPELEIQNTDNYIDWASLTYVRLEDINYSSRSVPIGTENPIDIATMTFYLPIWINPPAKIKKFGVIQKIIASIYDSDGNLTDSLYDENRLLGAKQFFTPLSYGVMLVGNQLALLDYKNPTTEPIGEQIIRKLTANVSVGTVLSLTSAEDIEPGMAVTGTGVTQPCQVLAAEGNYVEVSNSVTGSVNSRITFTKIPEQIGIPSHWRDLINVYGGNLTAGISEVRLTLDDGNEVIGTVAYHPNDDTVLLFTPRQDTLPTNNLDPVDAIIDPQRSRPNTDLPTPTVGTRYLLVNDYVSVVGQQPIYSWQGSNGSLLVARANDIIEYKGDHWDVEFNAQNENNTHYVTNLNTGVQYRWTGTEWVKSYEGVYREGLWTLVL